MRTRHAVYPRNATSDPVEDAVLRRLMTLRQMVDAYPGLFPTEHVLRWRLRILRGEYGRDDMRVLGVYRDRATGRILLDPEVFLKNIVGD